MTGACKEVENFVVILVIQILANLFIDHVLVGITGVRVIGFNHGQRNTVHKADQIGLVVMCALGR
ncbi:hypothetical protein CLV44_1281 [Marinobacterium halophilum]|uniref:Uncharacterized protein n=2 Tax=Marinobacterium halophilum TaxID=267374 RepID=A0A2P8EKG6_9GAMM|nr:hypothetical protein CLV44_1281 [Marinobacterium halophilum]